MPIPKVVITAALTVANLALNASRKIEGPRLEDTGFTGGDPGGPRQRIWGTVRAVKQALWGDELTEVKRRRKTKGGKFNDYTYYGSWAVDVACHEIAAVTRIWFDTHLVLDLTGAGPVSPFDFSSDGGGGGKGKGSSGGTNINVNDYLSIYLGTEDQEPDPRIEAETDTRTGIDGATPAYRGTAYAAFKEVPLHKFSNRIPQVTIEATSLATLTDIAENFTTDLASSANYMFSGDFSRVMWTTADRIEIWDVAARQRLLTIDSPVGLNTTGSGQAGGASFADGSWLAFSGGDLYRFAADGLSYTFVGTFGISTAARVRTDGNGIDHYVGFNATVSSFTLDGQDLVDTADICPADFNVSDCVSDGDSIWIVGRVNGSGETTVHFLRVVSVNASGPEYFAVTGLDPISSTQQGCSALFNDGAFVVRFGGSLYRIDPATQSVTASRSDLAFNAASLEKSFANHVPGRDTIFLYLSGSTAAEISLSDFSTVRTVSSLEAPIYEPINHAIWSRGAGGALRVTHLDRVQPELVTLGSIVSDVAALAGLEPGDIDVTALTQEIEGFSVAVGTGKDWLAPLLDFLDVDARPHGFQLQFVPRGGASLDTIDFSGFARPDGEQEPFYRFPLSGGTDVPRELVVKFKDAGADQQPNSALSGPIDSADGVGERVLDMGNLVMTPADAKQFVDRYHRRIAFDARSPLLDLPASLVALEPADRYTLGFASGEVDVRLASLEIGADGRMASEWLRDDETVALLDGADGADLDAHDPAEIVVPLPSKGFVLDIPLLQDSDEESAPVLYTAAGPYGDGTFPGATIWQAVDGEYSDEFNSVASSDGASWGYATDVLSDANPWLWDRGNSVNISLVAGELAGASEAAIDADPTRNLLMLGDEILQFANATLESDGSYTLSGLKRGRRGTEWACGTHEARDIAVLLDTADAVRAELSEVGTELDFKTITAGRSEGFTTVFTFSGASKKPYAPCHLDAVKQSNGDWSFSWVRRTRVGGAWTSASTIPLSEASEEYQLTVGDGVSTAAKTVTSASYTWTVAEQTTDTGAEVLEGDLAWSVAQVSDAVGPGFVAAA